jgi:preprotein translocase subunit YajC
MGTLALLVVQAQTTGKGSGGSAASLVLLAGMGVLFYFLLIRPQKARMRQQQELMKAVQVGDEVETIGGIYGTVTRGDDDVLWLEVAPGTTVKVSRAAVRRKVYADEPEETETPES